MPRIFPVSAPHRSLRPALALAAGVLTLLGSVPAVGALADRAKPDPFAKVTVTGNLDEKPTVQVAGVFSVGKSTRSVLTPGTGEKLAKGASVTIDYVVVNGRTGQELTSSYGSKPVGITLDRQRAFRGIVDGLVGSTVGSRTLIAIAPKEGLAKSLASDGVKKNDTLVFVVDVRGVRTPLARADGEAVAAVEGLPAVTLAKDGTPTIAKPSGTAPTTLVAQPLIKGTGAVVAASDTLTVHYTGTIWATGKTFDSSWDRNFPVEVAMGEGTIILGWSEGLVGQTVGSQVLLVVPPDKGYGAAGTTGISGTDTLVFVVDILDAY